MRPAEEMWTPPPRQRRSHPIARRVVLIGVALLVALVVTFIFVYQHAAAELDGRLKAESAVSHTNLHDIVTGCQDERASERI
jgi:hypothetical protein